jgi:glycosyltransferase involved in cell wall biosynthesis
VQPYKTGFLIDPYDVKDLQEKMEMIIKMSSNERLQMGNEAIQSASRFSVETYINNLVDFYSSAR